MEPKIGSNEYAYEMGKDCGKNGPTTENCDYKLFATRELTNEWERGKREAENEK